MSITGIVIFVLFVGAVFLFVLVGFNTTMAETRMSDETTWVHLAHDVNARGLFRFVDREASVVCWVFAGVNGRGVFCLPLSETGLSK